MTICLQLALVLLCYLTFVAVTSASWRYVVPQAPQRHALDVIRGWCASLVFVVHAVKTQSVFRNGHPYELPAPLKALVPLGDVGVIVFFFITGYLFFGVAYPKGHGGVAVGQFLLKRLRRLGPAFFAVATCAFLLHAWSHAGWSDAAQLFEDAVRIFSFGALRGDLTTRDPLMWNAINMSWTLEFEWLFYFMLALSMVLPGRRMAALILVLAMATAQWAILGNSAEGRLFIYFAVGGAFHRFGRSTTVLMAVALGVYLLGGKWSLASYLMFWGATRMDTVPKVLEPFATAGNITYSYYLFHGLVLLATYQLGKGWWGTFDLSNWRTFAFAIAAAALASGVSLFVYRFAELPYFALRAR